ncbi:MAG: hypothetical protein K5745_07845 [Saccharofermentans sp.]|nr:hypothetical protein [Saccharofermentans sp.]
MNPLAITISSIFCAIALITLLVLIFGNTPLKKHNFRSYFIASSSVYLSGTIMILIFALSMPKLPTVFVVISETMITFVFAFTFVVLYRMSKQVVELHEAILEAKKNDGSEEDS